MNNYYEFTKLIEDELSMDIISGMSNDKLKIVLDDYFNDIETYLNEFAIAFKKRFKGHDYDDYYYHTKSLIEELNDIKIILNILIERTKDE